MSHFNYEICELRRRPVESRCIEFIIRPNFLTSNSRYYYKLSQKYFRIIEIGILNKDKVFLKWFVIINVSLRYIAVELITHNYIIKYLIFCMESVFCDKINGTQFYIDR
ncbi:hypothetical protein FF021_17075 [Leptospira noguchii]|uniref:hypothetical protein n=1 Tax=Leptospira noguchii TaxID=28182 RepID=UPI0011475A4B|nr:hypothetical protein [Leptospira noguchii]TQE68015.1 hypothetical protein FF021_17075 [Leptospira noguchii]UOG53317.1 hypothetical protein MAL09_03805 [Leptospira noguchii]